MVIYLDEYRKAKAIRAPVLERNNEDRMCVNCGPVIAGVFSYRPPHELSPPLPDALTAVDRDAFLDRVYILASQI